MYKHLCVFCVSVCIDLCFKCPLIVVPFEEKLLKAVVTCKQCVCDAVD